MIDAVPSTELVKYLQSCGNNILMPGLPEVSTSYDDSVKLLTCV